MTEIVSTNLIYCQIEPWIGPEPGEEAFFNATPAIINGDHVVLLGRIVLGKSLPGQVDISHSLGVTVENGGGYAERVKVIDLSPWCRKLRVMNIEDFRLGKVENGSALAGINVVVNTREGNQFPLPGIAVIRNLNRPAEIEIEEMFVLEGEGGKNTLIISKASDPLIKGFYRPDGEKSNHVFAHFTYDRATGKKTVAYEYIEHPPKYGRGKMGLTGLPIELPAQPGEESRQLFILHGSRDRKYVDWEYGIGRALRIVDKEGIVKWIAEKEALLLPERTGRRRFGDKLIIYSTGYVIKEDANGGTWLIIAVSYNDEAVGKVTYSGKEVIEQPIDPVPTRAPNAV